MNNSEYEFEIERRATEIKTLQTQLTNLRNEYKEYLQKSRDNCPYRKAVLKVFDKMVQFQIFTCSEITEKISPAFWNQDIKSLRIQTSCVIQQLIQNRRCAILQGRGSNGKRRYIKKR